MRVSLSWERLILPLLGAFTFAAYCQVGTHDFVSWDDDAYVFRNSHLEQGLSIDQVIWAFTTLHFGNWHPLTWLSYLLDYEIYGLKPGGYHLTNLLLHVSATMLLFAALRRMTRAVWRSALVAALFGLHPLHVESVAWISERKDVLSGLFWMLTLWAYANYALRPWSILRYLLVPLCLILGLMAKPMLVTLPIVLLLLDYWPLGRLGGPGFPTPFDRARIWPLLVEKLPLLLIAAGSSWLALMAQDRSGAVAGLEELSLGLRASNAMVVYVGYISKAIWPTHLAFFYPHPGPSLSPGLALAAFTVLATISGLVFRFAARKAYLPVGWLWYLGTLVPVIGLVQVGQQAMADRYTYLPLTGLFLIAVWGGYDLAARWRLGMRCLIPATLVLVSALFATTWIQVSHWQDSITLFEHAVRVTPNNDRAHFNLASALLRRGHQEAALTHYGAALNINPKSFLVHTKVAELLADKGEFEMSRRHWAVAVWLIARMEAGLEADASAASADHIRAGTSLAKYGQTREAIVEFEEAVRLDASSVQARLGLGDALLAQNMRAEAIEHYREVLALHPDHVSAHYKLGIALMLDNQVDEATEHVSRALQRKPRHRGARYVMRRIEEYSTATAD